MQVTNTHLGSLVHRQLGDILIIQKYLAFIGLYQANDHVERSGFAGAIGAKQTYNFALAHLKRHIVDDSALAILLYQTLCVYFQKPPFKQK